MTRPYEARPFPHFPWVGFSLRDLVSGGQIEFLTRRLGATEPVHASPPAADVPHDEHFVTEHQRASIASLSVPALPHQLFAGAAEVCTFLYLDDDPRITEAPLSERFA